MRNKDLFNLARKMGGYVDHATSMIHFPSVHMKREFERVVGESNRTGMTPACLGPFDDLMEQSDANA